MTAKKNSLIRPSMLVPTDIYLKIASYQKTYMA